MRHKKQYVAAVLIVSASTASVLAQATHALARTAAALVEQIATAVKSSCFSQLNKF